MFVCRLRLAREILSRKAYAENPVYYCLWARELLCL